MCPGLDCDGARIFSCLECHATVPRVPRPDSRTNLKHHLENASLPDEAFDALLQAQREVSARHDAIEDAEAGRWDDERSLMQGLG